MSPSEIKNQVENLIRLSKISNQLVGPGEASPFSTINLANIVNSLFTQESKDTFINKSVNTVLVQYNRATGSIYNGEVAYALSKLLSRLDIKSYNDAASPPFVRDIAKVQYFGLTCELDKVGEAAIKMVNFINEMVAKDLVRGVLAPLTAIELVGGKIVIVSYIAVDQQNEPLVKSLYGNLSFQEGTVPTEFK